MSPSKRASDSKGSNCFDGSAGRVRELLEKALSLSTLERLELIGPESELAKLRGPLAGLNPVYYTLEYGFGVRL